MYQADPLEFCVEIFKFWHIRLQLFSLPCQETEEIDFGLRGALYQNYDYSEFLGGIRRMLRPGEVLYFCDEFGASYNAFLLSEGPVHTPYEFGVLGPWRRKMPSEKQIRQAMERCGLSRDKTDDIRSYLEWLPENMDREQWIVLITRTIGKLITPDGNIKFYVPDASVLKLPESLGKMREDMDSARNFWKENLSYGYQREKDLLDMVKKGNYAQAETLMYQYRNFQQEYRKQFGVPDSALGTELNSLLRHAAQEAGVNALRLDETYIKYCRLISRDGAQNSYAIMVREYCDLVNQYSCKNYSPVIRTCIDTADIFYDTPITLSQLAERCSVSVPYLSSLFHREMGISFTEYLNQVRVSHAENFLRNLNLSIQEVSARCGFNDPCYFSRVFKKYAGQSPRQYRNAIFIAKGIPLRNQT